MKIRVKCGNSWSDDYNEKMLMTLAAVESIKAQSYNTVFKVSVVTEVKMGNKVMLFNTYHLLKLAKMPKKAALLRKRFKEMHGIDIAKENESAEENHKNG